MICSSNISITSYRKILSTPLVLQNKNCLKLNLFERKQRNWHETMKTNTNLPQSTLTQLEHWLSTVAIHTLKQFFAFFKVLPWDNLICLDTSLGQHNKCVWCSLFKPRLDTCCPLLIHLHKMMSMIIPQTPAHKLHSQISHTLSLWLKSWKGFWKVIQINYHWSLKKVALYFYEVLISLVYTPDKMLIYAN